MPFWKDGEGKRMKKREIIELKSDLLGWLGIIIFEFTFFRDNDWIHQAENTRTSGKFEEAIQKVIIQY